jgi:hypothetical protein
MLLPLPNRSMLNYLGRAGSLCPPSQVTFGPIADFTHLRARLRIILTVHVDFMVVTAQTLLDLRPYPCAKGQRGALDRQSVEHALEQRVEEFVGFFPRTH